MSGELIIQDGAAGFVSVATGLALSANVWAQVHATNTIAALFTAPEQNYPEFDMLVEVTTGTPAENDQLEVALRAKADASNESPAPSGDYGGNFLGTITLDNTASAPYYGFRLTNDDKLGTLYVKCPTAVTISVSIRMRSVNSAV
jgi:hypothetical protein